jgi:hypothetical protein
MNLRNWSADAFAQDTWRVTPSTTIDAGVRYEFETPLVDIQRQWSNIMQENGQLVAFIGGQNGMPRGLQYPPKLRFAPRLGVAHHFQQSGLVLRGAYGIFYMPVDMNTWCNQLHNVPILFPITQQSDNFTPQISGFNFPQPVLGKTVVSFTGFDPARACAVRAAVERLAREEPGTRHDAGSWLSRRARAASAASAPDQQRASWTGRDSAAPALCHRHFHGGHRLSGTINVASSTFPVSSVNDLQDTARSWYDAGYLSLRRRYSHGLSLLANYTFAKNLSTLPNSVRPCRSPQSRRTTTI